MESKTEELLRSLVATQAAHAFVIDYLLKHIFLEIRKPIRLELARALLDLSERTEQFSGVAQDAFQAERLADLVVRAQHEIDQMIGRALSAAELAEGSR